MRFGLFVPQGWRHDLVGIEPADQWKVMTGLAQHADAGPWESIWVYDHFHTVPAADRRGHPRGVDADGRVRAPSTSGSGSARCARAWATATPPTSRRWPRPSTSSPAAGSRWASAAGWYEHEWRAYGYGFPPAASGSRMLDEGVQIMQQAWTDRLGDARTASTTRSTARSSGRCRCRRAASRSGSRVAARRSRSRSPRSTRSTRTSTAPRRGSPASREMLRGHCDDVGTDFEAITRSSNYNVAIGRDEAEVQRADRLAAKARLAPYVGAEKAEASARRGTAGCPPSARRSRSSRTSGRWRSAGMTYAIHTSPRPPTTVSGIELFEREVIPALA